MSVKDGVIIKNLPMPKPKTEVAQKGKISRNWRRDPEILARLTIVAQNLLTRTPLEQIAQVTGSSIRTVNRDVERVRTLWRETMLRDIEERVLDALYQYKGIQRVAWEEFDKDSKNRNPRYLQIILDAQNHIDTLEGTKNIGSQISLESQSVMEVEQTNVDVKQLTNEELIAIINA